MKDQAQRNAIADAALDKFRKYGIRRVTIDEIARDLRISKKTLYVHFTDKEALVRACAEKIAGQVIPAVKAAIEGPGTAAARVAHMWEVVSMIPRLVPVEFMADLRADYPHLWEEIDARRRAVFATMEQLVADGVESGEIHRTVHPKVVMRILLAMLEKVLTPDVMVLGEFAPAEAIATVLTIMTRGMFVRPPRVVRQEGKR